MRVQCKAYLAQPSELLTGLNLIHTTNLDYFTVQHQAEIFRLKGQFLQVRATPASPLLLFLLRFGSPSLDPHDMLRTAPPGKIPRCPKPSLSSPQSAPPSRLTPDATKPGVQALGEAEPANTAYSTALSLYQQLPDGWVSWGSHCDQMYQATHNTAWLDYAVTCYLQVNQLTCCVTTLKGPGVGTGDS